MLFLRHLKSRAGKPGSKIFKSKPVEFEALDLLIVPVRYLFWMIITAIAYGFTFVISMDRVAEDYQGILAFNWQIAETIEMFLPLLLHVFTFILYLNFMVQIWLNTSIERNYQYYQVAGRFFQQLLPKP